MKLYHGSNVGGIDTLTPVLSNHGKPYVYLTDNKVLATLYAHNPIERPGGFFTYRFDKEGRLHYDEYFDNQLEVMYSGIGGYVYTIDILEDSLYRLEKMPWVYTSEYGVDTAKVEYVEDIFATILRHEQNGDIVIHRYKDMGFETREKWRNIVRNDIENKDLKNYPESSYAQFLHKHFPDLI